MPTFILATKLSTQGLGELEKRESVGRGWLDTVKRKCPEVKWLHHYALLGPYDFLDIYEAPNEDVAVKVSMITMSLGAAKAESWTAIQYKKYLDIVKDL